MGKCCGDKRGRTRVKRGAKYLACGSTAGPENGPLAWFGKMIQNCYEYATEAKAKGKHIVGIMCEYTPRELIMAADAVPVCLCVGRDSPPFSASMFTAVIFLISIG